MSASSDAQDKRSWPAPFNLLHVLVRIARAALAAAGLRHARPVFTEPGFKLQLRLPEEELFLSGREMSALKKTVAQQDEDGAKPVEVVREEQRGVREQVEAMQAYLEGVNEKIDRLQEIVLRANAQPQRVKVEPAARSPVDC